MHPSIESSVDDIIKARWDIKDGRTVPKTEDIVMKNGGRLLNATYVYADLGDSSKIAQTLKKEAAAKIIRAYVHSATRILRNFDGEIRSFDGDRVMAIFVGESMLWNAVRSAFAINWAVSEVIRPAIRENWSDGENFYNISHRVGVDTGESLIVRGGARNNNDLISVGAAPNVAAKLSDLKKGYSTYITDRVFEELSDELLYYESDGLQKSSWRKLPTSLSVGGEAVTVYGSNVYWGL